MHDFEDASIRRSVPTRRPAHPGIEYLQKVLAARDLTVAQVTIEERALLHVMITRGLVQFRDGVYRLAQP